MLVYMEGGTWTSLPPQSWAMDMHYSMKLMCHMHSHLYLLHLQEFIFLVNRSPLLPSHGMHTFPWLVQSRVWNGFKNLLLKTFWWCGSANSCTSTKPLLLSFMTCMDLTMLGEISYPIDGRVYCQSTTPNQLLQNDIWGDTQIPMLKLMHVAT